MQFTITINGEGPELGKALKTLREVMDGHQITDGSVTATIQPAQQEQAVQPAPVQQPYPQQPYTAPATQPFPQQPYNPTVPQQQPVSNQSVVPTTPGTVPSAVPTSAAPTYTLDQLGVAAGPLVDAGRGQELTSWLQQRGVSALTSLDPAHYGDFAMYLRSLGARI